MTSQLDLFGNEVLVKVYLAELKNSPVTVFKLRNNYKKSVDNKCCYRCKYVKLLEMNISPTFRLTTASCMLIRNFSENSSVAKTKVCDSWEQDSPDDFITSITL